MSETARRLLTSASRSDDAGHLAANDLADIATSLEVDYRLIGGLSDTLLTWVYGVNQHVPSRETADADFGASPTVIGDARLLATLESRGYRQVAGNRLQRTVHSSGETLDLSVDLLTPSYKGRLVSNVQVGQLNVDEVPGLNLALAMPPVVVEVQVLLTDGKVLDMQYRLPDVVAALCMKAHAYRERLLPRDAVDVWRLLEAAHAAGIVAQDWKPQGSSLDASRLLYRYFAEAHMSGPHAATQHTQQQARIRTLLRAVVAPPPPAPSER
jgi:hypothetical protein